MKLKAYYAATPVSVPEMGNRKMRRVIIQLAATAAPAVPFVVLGDVNHETPDNANGMQATPINHALVKHITELLYTKFGVQTSQDVYIYYHAGVLPLKSFSVDSGRNTLKVGQESTITVRLLPANAQLTSPLTIVPSRPDLVEIISNSGGVLKYKGKAMGDLVFNIKVDSLTDQISVRIVPVEDMTP